MVREENQEETELTLRSHTVEKDRVVHEDRQVQKDNEETKATMHLVVHVEQKDELALEVPKVLLGLTENQDNQECLDIQDMMARFAFCKTKPLKKRLDIQKINFQFL